MLPKNYIVGNIIIKPCTDFQLFFSAILIFRNKPQFLPWPLYKSNKKISQSTLCWYSKLVSWDAWHNAKDEKLIRSSCDEKTSKNCWNNTKFDFTKFSTVLTFSQPRKIGSIFSVLHCVRLLKTQVQSIHKRYFGGFFLWLIKRSGLSSGPFQLRFLYWNSNLFFCVWSPKPNRTLLEHRRIRYWKKWFFNTPYCGCK